MNEFDKFYNETMLSLCESIFVPLTGEQLKNRKIDYLKKTHKKPISLNDAARIGWYDKVVELLNQGKDPKAYDSEPLRIASENGHMDIVQLLIPVSNPRTYYLALNEASANGHVDIVRLLVSLCNSKEYGSKAHGSDALKIASNNGYTEIVKLLIPISDPKADDSKALRNAVMNNRTETVKLLIPVSDPAVVKELRKIGQIRESFINEGIIGDILGLILKGMALALRQVFGVDGEKLYKGISETEQKTDSILVYNKLVKNFNELIGDVKLNAKYDSKTRPFFDIFINLIPLDSKSSEDFFKIGDMKKPLADRIPVQIPFKIIGYGVRIADEKEKTTDTTFSYEVKDKPAMDMSLEDMEEVIQTMFDESVARNKRLGIKLTVDTINLIVNSTSTADIDFDKNIYKKDESTSKDDIAILEQMKKYVVGTSATVILPNTYDELKIKGMPVNPKYLYVQPTIKKEIKDVAGAVIVKKGTALTVEKQYTTDVIKVMDVRLKAWKDALNMKFEDKEQKYGLKSITLLEFPIGSKHIKVVGGWTYLKFDWVK